jgi:hypothetical protein
MAAEQISNEIYQQTLLDAAQMIEDMLPLHIAAAREVHENPNDSVRISEFLFFSLFSKCLPNM